MRYVYGNISYEGIQRIERYFVLEAALREALLNAVCHKQYESCVPVQVSVYEDRLYVANVGTLPETWTKDNLLGKHESRPYNPNVATVMYYAGFIESWGRGIEKICTACEADGLPVPEYTVHPGDIMLKFTAPEDRIVRVTDRVTNKVTDQYSEKEKQLLQLLVEDPGYTMPQLAEKMGVSRKTIGIYLRKLKSEGIIERIGSPRKGYWKINRDHLQKRSPFFLYSISIGEYHLPRPIVFREKSIGLFLCPMERRSEC